MGSCSRMGGRESSCLGAEGEEISLSPFLAPINLVLTFCQASAIRVRRFRSPSSRLMSSAVGDEGCQGPGPQSAATSPLAAVVTKTDDVEVCRAFGGGWAASEETAGRSTKVEHSDQVTEFRRAPGIDIVDRLSKAGGSEGEETPATAAQARCAILLMRKVERREELKIEYRTGKRKPTAKMRCNFNTLVVQAKSACGWVGRRWGPQRSV